MCTMCIFVYAQVWQKSTSISQSRCICLFERTERAQAGVVQYRGHREGNLLLDNSLHVVVRTTRQKAARRRFGKSEKLEGLMYKDR